MNAPFLLSLALGCAVATNAWADPASRDDHVSSHVRGEIVPQDEPSSADGVYGRFDGDLTLGLGLGAEFGGGTRGAVELRSLYYHSAGLFLGYADSLDRTTRVRRLASIGAEIRPLFLSRWALDLEFLHPLLDLTLDSLSLAGAAFVAERSAVSRVRTGAELSLGMGVPLLAKAQGPWLEARAFYRPALDEASGGVLVSLCYYESWVTPIVK